MNNENILSALSEWSGWVPAAEQVLYLFTGALVLFVGVCIVAQLIEDKVHPHHTRNTTLFH